MEEEEEEGDDDDDAEKERGLGRMAPKTCRPKPAVDSNTLPTLNVFFF